MENEISKVVTVLRSGGIILYPTDTVWGLGCDATNRDAVAKIYALKQNENKKAMLILCANADAAVRYVNKAPSLAFDIMEMSEKPMTLILPNGMGIAENLIPEENTIGIRIPNHDFCSKLLYKFGKPIVSTSANISGNYTPVGLKEVSKEIIEAVDYVVNPRFQGKPTGVPSSIISLTEDGQVKVIRE